MRLVFFCGSILFTVAVVAAAVGLIPITQHGVSAASSYEPRNETATTAAPLAEKTTQKPATPPPSSASSSAAIAAHGDPEHAPASSGQGRRVVFDQSDQRVWLVDRGGKVARSYLVSGSIYDNLAPGQYHVYSKSLDATAFDLTSTMRYMVRFADGPTAAIGFHSLPRDLSGRLIERPRQLGTPLSHGCIRQRLSDARALWNFAPIDTPVVVVA